MDQDVLALGRNAARLLRDPAFVAAMDRAEQLILAEWSQSNASEHTRREELHAELRGLRRLLGRLQALELDGKQVDETRRLRA